MQLSLFETDTPGVINRNEHFAAVQPKCPSQRQRVLEYIESRKRGATRDEIANALGLPLASVCGRVNELVKSGAVVETDKRRTTSTGGTAVVLVTA